MKSSAFKESFLLTIGEKYYQFIRLYNSQSTSIAAFIALTSFTCFRKVMQDQGFRQDLQSQFCCYLYYLVKSCKNSSPQCFGD